MSTKNLSLKKEISNSDTDTSTEKDIISSLKQAEYILKGVQKSNNKELLNKFNKEYDDLKLSIKGSLEKDKLITISELLEIRLELSDIITLAENNNIIESKSIFSNFWNKKIVKVDIDSAKNKSIDLRKKDIEQYSREEAIGALVYLDTNYNTLVDKLFEYGENNISSLDSEYEIQYFQERLIENILSDFRLDNNLIDTERALIEIGEETLKIIVNLQNGDIIDNDLNEILKQNFIKIGDMSKYLDIDNIKSKEESFFINHPEYISFIETPDKFKRIFNGIKDKESITSNEEHTHEEDDEHHIHSNEITLLTLNKELRTNISVLNLINIAPIEFKLIPDTFFSIENSIILLNNNSIFSHQIIQKIFSISTLNKDEKISIINKSNLEESKKIEYLKKINTSKEELENSIINEGDIKKQSLLISNYIYVYGTSEKIDTIILTLLKQGEQIKGLETININNKEIAKELILSNKKMSIIHSFSKELRGDNEIIELLINKYDFNDINKYSNYIEIKNINHLLYIYQIIKEKFSGEESIKLILNPNTRKKISDVFILNKESLIFKKYKEDFITLYSILESVFEIGEGIFEVREHIKKHHNDGNSHHDEIEHEHSNEYNSEINYIKKELEKKDFSEEEIEEFINGNSQTTRELYLKVLEKLGGKSRNKEEALIFIKNLLEHKENNFKKQKDNTTIKIDVDKIKDLPEEIKEFFNEKNEINKEKLEKDFDEFRILFKDEIKQGDIIDKYIKKFDIIKDKKIILQIKEYLKLTKNLQETEFLNRHEAILKNYLDSGDEKELENLYYQDLKETVEERQKFKKRNPNSIIETKILDESEFNETGNGYSFIANGEEIKITLEEKLLIERSEEAKENLIKTKNTLDELNMGKLWNFRTQIFGIISETGLSINDGDYISPNELRLFILKILKSITDKIPENERGNIPTPGTNINEFKEKIKRLNKIGPIGGMEEVNMLGESYIENIFISKFANRYSSVSNFDALDFKNSLNKVNNI